MTQQQCEEMRQRVADLLKEYGCEQFVLAAHNCPRNLMLIARSKEGCGVIDTMFSAMSTINSISGGITVLDNDSNN